MVKKIVSRQIYDTDTATRLYYREGHGGDRYQGLYQTPEGAFFFWEYDVNAGCEDIKLTTDEEAYQWLEEHANHLLGQYFLEGRAAKRRLTVQLPANLVRRLEALAAEKSLSLNSYLRRSLKQQCASAECRSAKLLWPGVFSSGQAPVAPPSKPALYQSRVEGLVYARAIHDLSAGVHFYMHGLRRETDRVVAFD